MAFWVNYIIRTALILEVSCLILPTHLNPLSSVLLIRL